MRYGYPSITGHTGYSDDSSGPDDDDNGESSKTPSSGCSDFILGCLLILFILGCLIALIVSC